MKYCTIIVFDEPRYGLELTDFNYSISPKDIKCTCDFEDRWDFFNMFLKEEYKNVNLCRDNQGLVYDHFNDNEVYGMIL